MAIKKPAFDKWLTALGLDRASDMLVREQYQLVAKQIPVLYAIIIINCFFMAAVAATLVSWNLAFAFPAIAIPVMIYRIYYWRRQGNNNLSNNDFSGMRRVLRGNAVMANVLAMLLAAWSVSILFHMPSRDAAFVPVFTILSMITCAYCLSAYPAAAYSVILSGSTYITAAMAMTGDFLLIAMAANIGLVSVMVVYMVAHQHGQLRRLVQSGSKLMRQRGHAKNLAHKDQLTGLSNRRALIHYMRSQRNRHGPAAMIMIDMNGFKPVNDTFGHLAGDRLLVTIGERLTEVVGETGHVARLGGDEFCIFVPGMNEADRAQELAETILAAIKQPQFVEGHLLHLGAAIGIATSDRTSDNPHELLQRSDIALYEAKALGGNAISLFEDRMEARVRRRTLIEQSLADRQQVEGIELLYQPIFEMRTNRMVGYEALARWKHPDLGRVPPSEFIEAAERSGKARRLTLHLFRQAVAEACTWPDDLVLSFNLSGSGLCTAGFEESLPSILNEYGFAPERLKIEITETALLADAASAWRVLGSLRERGIRIVLDDFGAGHASIGYLRDLQLDGVKLDGSLIKQIAHDARSRKLLMGVLQLCRSIGVSVTAEMVETELQLTTLQAFPIDFVQGFFLGRPGEVGEETEDAVLPSLAG
ncbi:MAG: putative bifunctional diguanylate cyclase/phosphodiesterase [Novosphingobium sp.]